jgi:hypothetical protein
MSVLAELGLGSAPVTLRRARVTDLTGIAGIGETRRRGCALIQLTSDKSRADAHRFYERLGFTASHEGMKLIL